MGSFVGHVVPGTLFLVVGVWHIWCIMVRYATNPNTFRVKVWNPVPELLDSIYIKFFVNDPLKTYHMNEFEHVGMLLMFFLFSIIAVLSEKTSFLPLPEGALCLLSAAAFCAEYLLLFFHSTTHQGLEGHHHLLLVLLVALCILSVVAGAIMPTSFPADLCSGVAMALQGLWFYQTVFSLYGPSMPTGFKFEADEITCSSYEHEVHGQLLANVQMFGLVFLVFIGVVGAYVCADQQSRKGKYGMFQKKPLEGFQEQL